MIKRRPLFWITIFFAVGITAGHYIPAIYIFCSLLITASIIILYPYIFIKDVNRELLSAGLNKIILFAILFVLLGSGWIYQQQRIYESKFCIANWNNRGNLIITGEIVEDLRSLEGDILYLKPYQVETRQKHYPIKYGLIELNREYLPGKYGNGDLVKAEISLKEPTRQLNPGGFSYYKYLKRKGVYSQGFVGNNVIKKGHVNRIFKNFIISVKKDIISLIEMSLNPPAREIVKAVLLGERENLPESWQQKFADAGANHLLAISGLHVGFILLILLTIFDICSLPAVFKNILISLFMIFYIILTGGRSSVLRAGLLAAVFLWAPYFKREGDLFNILGFTALINLIINPYVLFNVGFQLTYTVLIMIVLWVDIFKKLSLKIISVSLAAQLGSAPITAYYFNQMAPAGLITNIWAIPLMAVVVFVEFIGLLMGLLHPVFAVITGKLTEIIIYFMEIGISGMLNIPFSNIEVASPVPFYLLIIYGYLLLIPFIVKPKYVFRNIKIQQKRIIVLMVIAAILICFSEVGTFFNNELEIIFFAVGQGDSILLKSPRQKYILIDGGGKSGRDSNQGERVILPYLRQKGIKKIDVVMVTHFDTDHALGLTSVLRQRNIGLLVLPVDFARNELSREIMTIAVEKEIPVTLAVKGSHLRSGQLSFAVLNPPENGYLDKNNRSIVIKMKYNQFSLLLTGDLGLSGEYRLLSSDISLQSDILKLGHHGSNTSSCRYFLEKVKAEAGIISVGKNHYGHPSASIIKRLEDLGINVWRTDNRGAIIIKTDGNEYNIRGFSDR